MNKIQSKDHYIGSCKINKISLSSYDDKNICLKMAIADFHIFINLLVHHTKVTLSNIKFILIISLNRTPILSATSFHAMKIYTNLTIFLINNI